MTSTLLRLLLIMIGLSLVNLRADDASANNETKLRDALRNTMVQLRDSQNLLATAQAAQAQSDKDNADLKAKVDALNAQIKSVTDQSIADKAASDKSIADLNAQVTDQTGQITRLNQSLTEWKNAYNQATLLAQTKEEARAKLALQAILLQRIVDDRERKNFALYKTGNEILVRYEQFSLGDALTAKEPFVGTTRAKLETLVQDYKDKLLDQAVTYGQPLPVAPPPTPSTPASKTKQDKTPQQSKPS